MQIPLISRGNGRYEYFHKDHFVLCQYTRRHHEKQQRQQESSTPLYSRQDFFEEEGRGWLTSKEDCAVPAAAAAVGDDASCRAAEMKVAYYTIKWYAFAKHFSNFT